MDAIDGMDAARAHSQCTVSIVDRDLARTPSPLLLDRHDTENLPDTLARPTVTRRRRNRRQPPPQ